MNIDNFIRLRPTLYHLTNENNLKTILERGKLISTKQIIELSNNPAYEYIHTTRRPNHIEIIVGSDIYSIRDQKPISEKNLVKCLQDEWNCGQFYNYLNSRVFMWSKVEFLNNHFKSYEHEGPIILRFETAEILRANPHVKFSRLNTGATRSSSHHAGGPPPRGKNTFLSANDYEFAASTVKEVTFEDECILGGSIYLSRSPYGEYKKL